MVRRSRYMTRRRIAGAAVLRFPGRCIIRQPLNSAEGSMLSAASREAGSRSTASTSTIPALTAGRKGHRYRLRVADSPPWFLTARSTLSAAQARDAAIRLHMRCTTRPTAVGPKKLRYRQLETI